MKERISFRKAKKDLSFRSDIRDSVLANRLSVVSMIRSMHLRPTGTVNVAGGLTNVTSRSVSSGKRMRDGEREQARQIRVNGLVELCHALGNNNLAIVI